jgi:hypothetical protein
LAVAVAVATEQLPIKQPQVDRVAETDIVVLVPQEQQAKVIEAVMVITTALEAAEAQEPQARIHQVVILVVMAVLAYNIQFQVQQDTMPAVVVLEDIQKAL